VPWDSRNAYEEIITSIGAMALKRSSTFNRDPGRSNPIRLGRSDASSGNMIWVASHEE
jgi:hypothetical protein